MNRFGHRLAVVLSYCKSDALYFEVGGATGWQGSNGSELCCLPHIFGNGSLPAVPTRQYNYLRGVFADTTFVYGDTPPVLNALIR
jgi:hypothetical protein